jgi:molybdopterin synthase sulfur carrier subunit
LRFSLHMDFVEADTALHDGDEVVLIPPVSGGSGCSVSPQNP